MRILGQRFPEACKTFKSAILLDFLQCWRLCLSNNFHSLKIGDIFVAQKGQALSFIRNQPFKIIAIEGSIVTYRYMQSIGTNSKRLPMFTEEYCSRVSPVLGALFD